MKNNASQLTFYGYVDSQFHYKRLILLLIHMFCYIGCRDVLYIFVNAFAAFSAYKMALKKENFVFSSVTIISAPCSRFVRAKNVLSHDIIIDVAAD